MYFYEENIYDFTLSLSITIIFVVLLILMILLYICIARQPMTNARISFKVIFFILKCIQNAFFPTKCVCEFE